MRPDPLRPRTWPLALTVPLQAALFTFLAALLTTQVALTLASEREERLVEESLAVLAAGIAAGVRPALPAGPQAVAEALDGIVPALDRSLAERFGVTWTDATGERHVIGPTASDAADLPDGFHVTRAFDGDGGTIVVTVVGDAETFASARLGDLVRVALVDLVLALIGAGVALWAVRITLAPVEALTAELLGGGRPAASTTPLAPVSTEFGRLQRLMNERIAAEEERAEALLRLAEQERTAGLAHLAASIAHEVRNPLAGLMNAVSTLRRFGDDPGVRTESLDLIERGLRSIERVAGAALTTYRPAADGSGFGPRDLADLEVLVAPEARRRGVALAWDVSLDRTIPVDAAIVRQVLLNILLNAVKASGAGGRTGLSARLCDGELEVTVSDTGPGLPSDVRRFLAGGSADPFPRPGALGLWTVMRLLDDIGGRLAIDTHPGRGTTVTINAPLAHATPAAAEEGTGGPA